MYEYSYEHHPFLLSFSLVFIECECDSRYIGGTKVSVYKITNEHNK